MWLEQDRFIIHLDLGIDRTGNKRYITKPNLRDLLIGLNEPNHEVSIPYVTIKKEWETIDEVPEETAFEGVGVLSKDGFKGFIKDSTANCVGSISL
ncbi:hypothetical protein [Lysinibacillus sphaericus]|uniref:Spore germination protein n=1 Tax=Lysinibacillus sphaericus OT4b.31 TaxID=1285586 RepID=R7Z953_LYSSH|nr:hypothetical protein [Lysinibacillus sphaericus]EON70633.1 spore germination protein [Lysinibacillus sphaericus OT4b.31]